MTDGRDSGADPQELLRAGRPDEALALLEQRLDDTPDDTGALYLAAVCARFAKHFDLARRYLDNLLILNPEDGRGLQEYGHWYRDQGRLGEAVNAYRRAIDANPALLASLSNRVALLRELGTDAADLRLAEAQLAHLSSLPKAVVTAMDLLAQGRVFKAEELCRQFLRSSPRDTQAMRLLAEIGVRLGALEEAQFLLETASELEPPNHRVRIELIRVLSKRQRFDLSLREAERLLAEQPSNLQFQSLRAIELLQLGEYDAALQAFDAILERLPGDAVTLTSRGHALKTRGSTSLAIESYEAAAGARVASGEAWYALANLKTYRFVDEQIRTMEERLQQQPAAQDRIYLSFALGKAFEDREAYDTSFAHYLRGNELKQAQLRYSRGAFSAEVDAQIEACDGELFARFAGCGEARRDPIFVLGMPRAGSTLVEQILASHSQIDGTRELPGVLSLAQRLRRRSGAAYPSGLHDLDASDYARFGREYLDQARVHRGSAPFFIDKMPNNFRHIGLIHLMLPGAKIIDARREARACCFSNFKQLFAEGQEFSYDLANLGQYYRDYLRLMAHWDRVLPGRVYRLDHERLLDDFEGELARVFAFLELPLEESCLRYYETDRPVRTPSSEQVRQPLFRDSQRQWQNYAPWLQPLFDSLAGEG